MANRDLDRLIRAARGAEAPSAAERAQVREALARRIASGDALPDLDGASLSPLPARSWLRGAGAVPVGLGGLGVAVLAVAALAGYGLAGYGLAGYGLGRDVPSAPFGAADAQPSTRAEPAPRLAPAPAPAPSGGPPSPMNASPPEDARATLASANGSNHPAASSPAASSSAANSLATSSAASAAPSRAGASAGARSTLRAPVPSAVRAPLVDPEAERRALARVQHALRDGRFAEAVAGLDRDDRAFTGGALVEERAAARVLALCGSGDATEAQQRATAFVARYPGSPLRSRVLASCPAPAEKRAP